MDKIEAKYYCSVDILKFLLSYLICTRHFLQAVSSPDSILYLLITNIFSTLGVPLFFIISGFIFFSNKNLDIKKYSLRICMLYLLWSIVYLPLNLFFRIPFFTLCQNFFFSGFYYHLWFLPSVIFAVFFIYLLRNISVKYLFIFTFFLFLLALFSDSYSYISPFWLNKFYGYYNNIFVTTRNGLFLGSIFVLIGKIFADNVDHFITCMGGGINYLYIIGMLVSLLFLLLEGIILQSINTYQIINVLFFTLPAVFFIFMLTFTSLRDIAYSTLVRKMSTVIYCAHPIFIIIVRLFTKNVLNINSFYALLLLFIMVTSFAFLLVKLSNIKKFEFIKYFF